MISPIVAAGLKRLTFSWLKQRVLGSDMDVLKLDDFQVDYLTKMNLIKPVNIAGVLGN